MPYPCLIVDDEPLALDLLQRYVGQLNSLTLVGRCADAFEALNVLHTQPIDLLFTDVKMPQLSGIQLVETLANPPKVILTTAFSEYALSAFDIGVVDYLVKPFSFERFLKAVNRALGQPPANVPAEPVADNVPTCLFLKIGKQVTKVQLADVLYWQAYGNYVKVFLRNGEYLLATDTLTNLAGLLPSPQFVRIHKSYIVPTAQVTGYQGNELHLATTTLPIGDLYRKSLLDALRVTL